MAEKIVLFLVGTYLDKPSANGICCKALAKKYLQNGYEVHCICFGTLENDDNDFIEDGIIIHPVKMTFRFKLLKKFKETNNKKYLFVSRLLNRINILNYPFLNIKLLINYYQKVKSVSEKNKIDIIISIYHPIEALYSGNKIKRKLKNIFLVLYSLDTLTNFTNKKSILNKYLIFKNKVAERRYYQKANLIINMKCHENHYKKNKYNFVRKKMEISDIPLLEENPYLDLKKDEKNNQVVYAGSLNKEMRNPTYICKFFLKYYEKNKDIKVDFYSNGNGVEIIRNAEIESNGLISLKKTVSHDEIIQIIKNSNCVISMENKDSTMIPSKIFEYMSYQKKIIHFSKTENDILLEYLKKYPNVLIINEKDEIDKNVMKLADFMQAETVIKKNLSADFPMNFPQYTYELIEKKYQDYIKDKKTKSLNKRKSNE